ncbi:hypothetical protein DSS3PM1_00045 [Bacteriophage DSS3_PM1]|nr:hypothetical protein DSS3PM1_00045 [Bacteriophage DSS3_PM1]
MTTPNRLTPADIEAQVMFVDYHHFEETCVVVCCITLKNGYNTIGHAGCVDPENFDLEIGKKIAYENALNEIWQLEGYMLKEAMYQDALDKAGV